MTITLNVSYVIEKLAAQDGYNVSVSGIDDTCHGCVITTDTSFVDFLAKHALPYNFQIIDGDPIRIVRHAIDAVDYEIAQADCIPRGGAAVSFKRTDTSELPREVEIQYTDPDREFATTTRTARHLGAPSSNSGRSIQLDFVITADQARAMAFDTLYRIWSQQLSISFEHRDITIEAGDVARVTCDQGIFVVRVNEATYTSGRTTLVQATVLLSSSGISIAAGEWSSYVPTNLPSDYAEWLLVL